MNHTKGPWQVHYETIVCTNLRTDPIDSAYQSWDTIADVKKNNAPLIAAAPEMFELLQRVAYYFDGLEGPYSDMKRDIQYIINKASWHNK